jgi:hypothetical protein
MIGPVNRKTILFPMLAKMAKDKKVMTADSTD